MKALTPAHKQEVVAQERRFKSAVVRFACSTYTEAFKENITGAAIDALHAALDDVGEVGPEELREITWTVEDCITAKRTAALGL